MLLHCHDSYHDDSCCPQVHVISGSTATQDCILTYWFRMSRDPSEDYVTLQHTKGASRTISFVSGLALTSR